MGDSPQSEYWLTWNACAFVVAACFFIGMGIAWLLINPVLLIPEFFDLKYLIMGAAGVIWLPALIILVLSKPKGHFGNFASKMIPVFLVSLCHLALIAFALNIGPPTCTKIQIQADKIRYQCIHTSDGFVLEGEPNSPFVKRIENK